MSSDTWGNNSGAASGGSDVERSPLPAGERLDEEFTTFLTRHISSTSVHPSLRQSIRDSDILNPFPPGDRFDNVTRYFVDNSDDIRSWIADGSPLKDRLRDYPAVYRRIWPEDTASTSNPGVGSSPRGKVAGIRKRKSEDGDEPDRQTSKRRHVVEEGVEGSAQEHDGLFGSPYESSAETETYEPGQAVRYTESDPAVEAIYRQYRGAEPPLPAFQAFPFPPTNAPQRRRSEQAMDDDPTVDTPDSSPPPSEHPPEPAPQVITAISPSSTSPSPSPAPAPAPARLQIPPLISPLNIPSLSLSHPRLPSRPPRSQPRNPHPPPPESISSDEHERGVTALSRTGWEWTEDTVSHVGTRQPPLGVRLEHALNFLREEDRDRFLGWEDKLREVEDWINWIRGGGGGYLARVGREVKNMIAELEGKIRGVRLWERSKYGTVGVCQGIKSEGEVAKPKRGWREGVTRRMRALEVVEEEEDVSRRRVLVARPERVHTQFPPLDEDDDEVGEVESFLVRLNDSEKAFWGLEDGERDEYLFTLENAAYEACSRPGGPLERFKTAEGGGGLVLPGEEELPAPPGGKVDETEEGMRRHAVERGARRAALQAALRCFGSTEQGDATTEWDRVVPAVEEEVLGEVRADLDRNYQWQPDKMAPKEKLETMPYTVVWRMHRKLLANLAGNVLDQVNVAKKNTKDWVTLPEGVAYGGPYVWRMVGPDVEEQQDLLKECEAVYAALQRTPVTRIEGEEGSFLADVQRHARNGANGFHGITGSQRFPEELDLSRLDPRRKPSRGHLVSSITRRELPWLGFLTSKAVNKEMLDAAGESPPKLYSIFVRRLEKAMDDRTEGALFLEPDGWRTIEELLPVINKGSGDGRRVQFSPFEIRYFLERAQDQGLCRYKNDHLVYGRVARSLRDIEPFDRVSLAATWDEKQFPDLEYPEDIHPFHSLPDLSDAERKLHRKFFLNLALRLGVTLFRLRKEKDRWARAAPINRNLLADALHIFNSVYRSQREKYASSWGSSTSLATLVKELEPALWERYIRPAVSNMPSGQQRTAEMEEKVQEAAALGIIRHRIIRESHENKSMLGRGREIALGSEANGGAKLFTVPSHNWDWASAEVRGQSKRYFSLDRWPLELQSEETRRKIEGDEDVDERIVFDAKAEDPVPQEYFRPVLRRYGADRRLRHRPGPAVYPIGDTPLQRRAVREMLIGKIARATGSYAGVKKRGWKERLAGVFRRSQRSPSPDEFEIETSLPEVDPRLVPRSWTPRSNSHGGDLAVEEVEEDDEVIESVEEGDYAESGDDVSMEGA